MVICPERGADCLHMVQLMPLPSADGSAVCTWLSCRQPACQEPRAAARLRQLCHGTDRGTDGTRYRLMPRPPTAGGITAGCITQYIATIRPATGLQHIVPDTDRKRSTNRRARRTTRRPRKPSPLLRMRRLMTSQPRDATRRRAGANETNEDGCVLATRQSSSQPPPPPPPRRDASSRRQNRLFVQSLATPQSKHDDVSHGDRN